MIRRIAYAIRRQVRALMNHGVILIYHRVTNLSSDPQLLAVSPIHFAEQMEILRKHFTPVSLPELTTDLKKGNRRSRSVAITFDDGYADAYLDAKPILDRFEIPATVFVTTGFIESANELWWDDLERLILLDGTLPSQISLNISGKTMNWDLGNEIRESRGTRKWNVEQSEDPTSRHTIYRSLHKLMRNLSDTERSEILGQLSRMISQAPASRPTHRGLTRKELITLSESDFIQVGAHTKTHSVLSTLDAKNQEEEIGGSKKELQEIINRPVSSFAYPYGTNSDYNQTTIEVVKKCGFQQACSNFPGALRPATDLYQLPRFLVRDYGGEVFQERLHEWFRF